MEASVWSCPAIRLAGKAKFHGALCLMDNEFVFFHSLTCDIIPINLDVVYISEQLSRIPKSISLKKHNILTIDDVFFGHTEYFIVEAGTAAVINEHIKQLWERKNEWERNNNKKIQEETNYFNTLRRASRRKRRKFRRQLEEEKKVREQNNIDIFSNEDCTENIITTDENLQVPTTDTDPEHNVSPAISSNVYNQIRNDAIEKNVEETSVKETGSSEYYASLIENFEEETGTAPRIVFADSPLPETKNIDNDEEKLFYIHELISVLEDIIWSCV